MTSPDPKKKGVVKIIKNVTNSTCLKMSWHGG